MSTVILAKYHLPGNEATIVIRWFLTLGDGHGGSIDICFHSLLLYLAVAPEHRSPHSLIHKIGLENLDQGSTDFFCKGQDAN